MPDQLSDLDRPASPPTVALGVVLTATIFVTDLILPVGVATAMLYVLVVLIGLWSPGERYPFVAAVAGTILTVVDFVVHSGGQFPLIAAINRPMIVLVIWVTAFGVVRYRRLEHEARREAATAQRYLDIAGVMIVALDAGGCITLINRKGCELLGYAASELVGHDWFETAIPSRDREEVRRLFGEVIAGRAETAAAYENRVVTRRGDERIIAWHNTLLRDAGGRIIGTLSSGDDITDRKRTEEALDRSIKELSDIKSALDQAAIVATTDVSGIIKYVNDKFCEISKYSREELLGQDHRIINSAYHSKEFIRNLWRTIAKGEIWRGEIRNRAKDGTYYWVDTTIVPFLDERGKPYQYMAIRSVITERKRAEETLREQAALTRLGQMAAVVAHEVKNPLAGVRGAIQVIDGRLPAGSAEHGILKDIVDRLDALNELISDLLLFARPRPLRVGPVQIGTLLQDTAALLGRDAGLRNVAVQVTGGDPLLTIDGDLLKATFLNLFLNAAQAMGGAGTIRVSVETADGSCRVSVADSGPGIPPEMRDRIFEPFFTTKHRGTGLGLAVAKRSIELHHGAINVTSPPGGGTAFVVTLPLDIR